MSKQIPTRYGAKTPQGSYPMGQPGPSRPAGYGMRDGQAAPHQQMPPAYPGYAPAASSQGRPPHAHPAYANSQAAYEQQAYTPPATSMPAAPKRKRHGFKWVLVVLLVLCLIAAGAIVWFMLQDGKQARAGSPGQLDGKSAEEVQAELDRIVEEGMFNISIASVVQMANGTSPADLRIENVPGNRYLMQVDIALDDTGEIVYSSGVLEPNFHIQTDMLDVVLAAGVYDATATFTALDPDTEELVGTAAAKVLIQVQA